MEGSHSRKLLGDDASSVQGQDREEISIPNPLERSQEVGAPLDWQPILGPQKGWRMNRATAILREIKVKFNSMYDGVDDVELWYESAIEEYCTRIRDEFVVFANESRTVILSQVYNDHPRDATELELARQPTSSTTILSEGGDGMPSIEEAILDFFRGRDMPSTGEHVVYYRTEFEQTLQGGLIGPELETFGEYLDFCEECMTQAGTESMSYETFDELSIISTLGNKWREMKKVEPNLPSFLDDSDEGETRSDSFSVSPPLLPRRARLTASRTSDILGNAKLAAMNRAFLKACERGDLRSAEKLFNQGASLYVSDSSNESGLQKAVRGGHLDLARFLVLHGVSPLQSDESCNTLLHLAASNGPVDVLQWLTKEEDLNVDETNLDGEIALHVAAKRGCLEEVTWLFDKSTNAFVGDSGGDTALHKAAKHGRLHVVKWLCENGGFDTNIPNAMSSTPLDLAVWSGEVDVAHWIKDHEAASTGMDSSGTHE